MVLVLLGSLLYKFLDFVKAVRNGQRNTYLTQLTAWVVGVGLVFLFAKAKIAADVKLGSIALVGLDGWSKTILGLSLTSLVSAAYDAKKSIDSSDSAKTAPMFGVDPTP